MKTSNMISAAGWTFGAGTLALLLVVVSQTLASAF